MSTAKSFPDVYPPAGKDPEYSPVRSLVEQAWALRLENPAQALVLLDEARCILCPVGSPLPYPPGSAMLYARIIAVQARCRYVLAEYPVAEQLAQEALLLYEEAGDEAGIANVVETLGLIQWNAGVQARALENLFRCLTLYRRLGCRASEARVLNVIGLVYNRLGDFGNTLEYLLQALPIFRELGDRTAEYHCIGNMGIVYAEHGDYETALEHYRTCLAYEQSIGNTRGECKAYNNIGVTHSLMGDYTGALNYLLRGLALLRKIDDKNGIGMALCNLAEAYTALEDYRQAYAYATESLAIRESIGDRVGMAGSLLSLGDLLTQLEDYNQAHTYLLRALEYTQELEAKVWQYNAHEKLYILYRRTGDTARALEHLEQFHAIRQLVHNADNSRRLASLRTLHQVEAAKQEAERYRLHNAELTGINEQLQTLNREKNEMMGIVAHDLKNPLAGILLLARTLHEEADHISAGEIREFTSDMEMTVSRMFDLITNLLDINRIETQGVAVQRTECDLSDIIRATVRNHQSHAATKSITIACNTRAPHLPAHTDERVLGQIIDNILSNAIKFSFPDSTVHVSLEKSGTQARIVIRDEGPGLTPEDKQKLFQKFARLSARPTGNEHSTGLGLSIVKKLVEALDGTVRCESEPGEGTAFIVMIPA